MSDLPVVNSCVDDRRLFFFFRVSQDTGTKRGPWLEVSDRNVSGP